MDSHSWERVHRDIQSLAKRRANDDATELALILEAERHAIWRHVARVSLLDYLERELGYPPKAGRERIRVARALASLPALAQLLHDGAVSFSVVRELTRVATPETIGEWIAATRDKSVREVEELVRHWSPGSRPDDPPDVDPPRPLVFEDVTPDAHAIVREARNVLAKELGHTIDDTTFVKMAFGAILQTGVSNDQARPSHQIAVTECRTCHRASQHGGGREFPLDAAALDRARCDAAFIGSLDTDEVARAKADIPPATRRLVLQRDDYACRFPGCRSTRFLDLHHIRHREHGGGHDPSNLLTACAAHHGYAHAGLIEVTGTAPDNLHFNVTPFAAAGSTPKRDPLPRQLTATRPPSAGRLASLEVEVQVRDALVAVGFKPAEAREAIALAMPHVGHEARLEVLLREALRRCRRPTHPSRSLVGGAGTNSPRRSPATHRIARTDPRH